MAKAYGVHPNSASAWKRTFPEKGPEVFAQAVLVAEYERRIAELERLEQAILSRAFRGEL